MSKCMLELRAVPPRMLLALLLPTRKGKSIVETIGGLGDNRDGTLRMNITRTLMNQVRGAQFLRIPAVVLNNITLLYILLCFRVEK